MNRNSIAIAPALLLAGALSCGAALGQAPKPEAHETNVEGVTAEISEAVRKEGVLTVKMRLRNTGASAVKMKVSGDFRDADTYYVVAGNTKFLVLKDSKSFPVMVQLDNYGGLRPEIKPGGSFLFWAKYPAPPAEARKFTFYSPLMAPVEDIPITEAK
jgi:hypothetical protein